jgi:transposase
MWVQELVSDALWAVVERELPRPKRRARWRGGRPRVPDRACLTGIIFVLKTGIPWEYLPQEMGCGSGMTCWRRLRDWQRAGVWARIWRVMLDRLAEADAIDWRRAALDSSSIPAKKGEPKLGRIQRIKANRARSAMLWSMPTGFRSPSP